MASILPYIPPREHRSTVDLTSTSFLSPPISRNSSTSSITSHKSEPGWMTSMNGVDRSRASSTTSQTSHASTKSSGGFSKLFGKNKGEKKKKEKKDIDQIILTSRHAAAVKTKLALDPQYKKAMQKNSQPVVVGTQKSAHLTAMEQEMRHPHSGPPALHVVKTDKVDMPMLTRIISGDEADEPDDWEKLRQDWRARQAAGAEMMQVLEGEPLDNSNPSSGTTTPKEDESNSNFKLPLTKIVEREGVRIITAADLTSDDEILRPRPERQHTPIGGRWKKDDRGVWKR